MQIAGHKIHTPAECIMITQHSYGGTLFSGSATGYTRWHDDQGPLLCTLQRCIPVRERIAHACHHLAFLGSVGSGPDCSGHRPSEPLCPPKS